MSDDLNAAETDPSSGPVREFAFTDKVVRTVMRDGDPWFVAGDVCEILEHTNSRVAVERLQADEKGVATVYTPGGPQEMNVISESGLYSLVMTSRKPQAEPFQRWVTREVLPSIRRTGAYVAPETVRPQRFTERGREPFYHGGMDTMAVSTSPGPHVGSLSSGDVTVAFTDFMGFMARGYDVPDGLPWSADHPNEAGVLVYLGRVGLGAECARNPLNGNWLFKMSALQHWYRNVGSVMCSPPR